MALPASSGRPIYDRWVEVLHLAKEQDSKNFATDEDFILGKVGHIRLIEIPNGVDTHCRDLFLFRRLYVTANDFGHPVPARLICRDIYVLEGVSFHWVDVECRCILQMKKAQLYQALHRVASETPLLEPESPGRVGKIAPDSPRFALSCQIDAEIDGHTGLMWAVLKGQPEVVRFLVYAGANIHVRDAHGRTPLMYAAMQAEGELVKLLIEKGADVQEALVFAAKNGEVAMAEQLVKAGVFVDAGSSSWTPLMYAASNGHQAMMRLLINKGADAARTLIFAAQKREVAMATALIDMGADLETRDRYGWTPLLHAARKGWTKMVKLLLEKKAAVDTPDPEGMTALMLAAEKGRRKVVKLLIAAGANPHLLSASGQTALFYAEVKKRLTTVDLLLSVGAGNRYTPAAPRQKENQQVRFSVGKEIVFPGDLDTLLKDSVILRGSDFLRFPLRQSPGIELAGVGVVLNSIQPLPPPVRSRELSRERKTQKITTAQYAPPEPVLPRPMREYAVILNQLRGPFLPPPSRRYQLTESSRQR
jgi:ankyrin repeat protein